MDNWQTQFSSGFSGPDAPVNLAWLWWFLALVALAVMAWVLWNWWSKIRRRTQTTVTGEGLVQANFVPRTGQLNPLQKKILQQMIADFQASEPAAGVVNSSLLEHFGEFFYRHQDRLSTNAQEVAEFVNFSFPLTKGLDVEIDLPLNGDMHLMACKLLSFNEKTLVTDLPEGFGRLVERGMKVQVNLAHGKHFLHGSSEILSYQSGTELVLRRPSHMEVSAERRYPRFKIQDSFSVLTNPETDEVIPVQVLDLSPEGVRISVQVPLAKTKVYQLNFSASDGKAEWSLGPFQCLPTQVYLKTSRSFEIGLSFVFVSLDAKAKLVSFLKSRLSKR